MYFFLLLFCFYSFVYTDADVTDSPIDVTVDVVIEQPEAANDTTSQQQAQDNLLPQTEQTQTTIQDSSVEGDVVQQPASEETLSEEIVKIPSQKVPVPTQENAKDTIEIEEEEDTQEDDQAAIMQKMIETMETDDLDSDSEQVPSIIVKNQPTHAPVLATMPTTATLNVQERNNPAVTTAKTVTITNAITQEQITYTHWTGTYVPEFTVTVQNEHIGMSETKTIEIGQQQQITVSYDAHFPAQRSSQDSTVVTLQDTTKAVAIQFDWQGNPRLKIEQS